MDDIEVLLFLNVMFIEKMMVEQVFDIPVVYTKLNRKVPFFPKIIFMVKKMECPVKLLRKWAIWPVDILDNVKFPKTQDFRCQIHHNGNSPIAMPE
jgi:hypothetical protein